MWSATDSQRKGFVLQGASSLETSLLVTIKVEDAWHLVC